MVKVKQSCQEYSGECINFQGEVTDCASLLKRGILKLKTNAKKESTLKKKKKKRICYPGKNLFKKVAHS